MNEALAFFLAENFVVDGVDILERLHPVVEY